MRRMSCAGPFISRIPLLRLIQLPLQLTGAAVYDQRTCRMKWRIALSIDGSHPLLPRVTFSSDDPSREPRADHQLDLVEEHQR